jgi:hypothetical protein
MSKPMLAVAIVLALTAAARAQDRSATAVTLEERMWAETIKPSGPRRVEHFESKFGPSTPFKGVAGPIGADEDKPQIKVTHYEGVRATFDDATVERLAFHDFEDASIFVSYIVDVDHGPVLVEQRDRQVVIVRDPALRSRPEVVEIYRNAVWSGSTESYLVAWIDAEKHEGAVTGRWGPVVDALRRTFRKASETAERDPSSATKCSDGSYFIKLRSGFTARVGENWAWFTRDRERAQVLARVKAALTMATTPKVAPADPTKGAASVVDGR